MSRMHEELHSYGVHDKGSQQLQNFTIPRVHHPPPEHAAERTRDAPITVQTHVVSPAAAMNYGPHSQMVTCPSCGIQGRTKVESKATTRTHMMALLLCCCLCWPCVCVPYCCASCQNRNHYCKNCDAFMGTYTS